MNCKWCENPLTKKQVYEFLRGKTKGNSCSRHCSMKLLTFTSKEDEIERNKKTCVVCNSVYFSKIKNRKVCSNVCVGVLSSQRMSIKNPMFLSENRIKSSNRLKDINHKPIIQGGNGRGATVEQLMLYNEITKNDGSFQMEYIEKTGNLRKQFNSPNHYKIDIASNLHMIAIEVDGNSHNTLKNKECDNRKTELLSLKGWKVLRFTNFQIKNELNNCVQMVLSMT